MGSRERAAGDRARRDAAEGTFIAGALVLLGLALRAAPARACGWDTETSVYGADRVSHLYFALGNLLALRGPQ